MLSYGPYVALLLLIVWFGLVVAFVRRKIKNGAFSIVSGFMVLLVTFFWLGEGITEFSIDKVGSFKTNVEEAHKYFDEIKAIR